MLAAEDNAVNKKLLPRLLAKAGQMPKVDGLEAIEADGERCLAFGMGAMLDRWRPRPIETARSS
jgi:hypothetical protein